MVLMAEELFQRLGKARVLQAAHLLNEDWGPALAFPPRNGEGQTA
jgi:hypothetical protein